jgi:aminotransferase
LEEDTVLSFLDRLERIPPSLIRKFFELTVGVKGIVNLSIGEPDFDTPEHIKEYAIEAIREGRTKYTPNQGLPMLREAIARLLEKDSSVSYDPCNEIIVTVGANMPVFMALASILREGDEVLVPEPAFVSYEAQVTLAGGRPVPVKTRMENGFQPTSEDLERALTSKTRAIIINTPNNPTGTVYPRKTLEEIAGFAVDHDLMVISDEVYQYLVFDGFRHVSIASLNGMKDRVILVHGFSKTFAMTGWRIGFAAGPKEIISRMVKIHMYTVTCPPAFIQYAVARAIDDPRSWKSVEEMRRKYEERRNYVYGRLKEIGYETIKPRGAFYIFPSIRDTGLRSMEYAKRLLNEEKVAVVPGIAFGEAGENHIRISYAASMSILQEAMKRIERFTARIVHR